ncbi:hypothetical protein TRIATDRAFT_300312 [Trichoderma atroviride IMI 206040]|uniref:Uncharacterized protein n=1 Tax=Hypocrea atroviridis (strain ATCC 20476 / IMI 206040) TaxID=452589 RepID=G9NZN8_HYPAI|nr:uncharacterized protein TRIATDRAFT_300312 [Trichoderma atroviride IMI 206040]EHK43938.1 hypothetical protein TRIATDRAFT_300312 [Trichoderma atroviride IMI 206040]
MKLLPRISAQDQSGTQPFKELFVAHRLRRTSPPRVQNPYYTGSRWVWIGPVLQRQPLVCENPDYYVPGEWP